MRGHICRVTNRFRQLFWKNLAPTGSEETKFPTSGALAEQVKKDFGGLDGLKEQLTAQTLGIQGSGWGWLVSGGRKRGPGRGVSARH